VTRAADQAADLVAVLREAGAEPACVPMTETKAFDDERFTPALRALDQSDAIVFTSANAVRALGERLVALGRPPAQLRARVLCVGPGTASAARRAGFAAPEVPASRYDAESLAQAVRDVLPPAGRRFLSRAAPARDVVVDRRAGAWRRPPLLHRRRSTRRRARRAGAGAPRRAYLHEPVGGAPSPPPRRAARAAAAARSPRSAAHGRGAGEGGPLPG
jgi:hypothetical protein